MSVTEPTIALTREILIAENMQQGNWEELGKVSLKFHKEGGNYMGCLLYTSDAADEL